MVRKIVTKSFQKLFNLVILSLAIIWMAYLVLGKLLYQFWHCYATGQIVIVVNGQRLNSDIAIRSRWLHGKRPAHKSKVQNLGSGALV